MRKPLSFAIAVMKLVSIALVGHLRGYRAIEAKTAAKAMISVAQQQNVGVTVYEPERIQILSQA